jgi:hypothetical protein
MPENRQLSISRNPRNLKHYFSSKGGKLPFTSGNHSSRKRPEDDTKGSAVTKRERQPWVAASLCYHLSFVIRFSMSEDEGSRDLQFRGPFMEMSFCIQRSVCYPSLRRVAHVDLLLKIGLAR